MQDIREDLIYQRVINYEGRMLSMVASFPPGTLSFAHGYKAEDQVVISIDGIYGADMTLAISSTYTAATQGMEMSMIVGDVAIYSRQMDDGSWVVIFNQQDRAKRFLLPFPMVPAVITALHTLLNDVTGEYRRQINEIEARMAAA